MNNQNRYDEGRFTHDSQGLGSPDAQMVESRAREIARINGRDQVLDTDREQARRELTGKEGLVPETTPEENIPEGTLTGIQNVEDGRIEPVPTSDEQTFSEKLVEEGVQDAEHDLMRQASKEGTRRNIKPQGEPDQR
jgi:hypothetical protein